MNRKRNPFTEYRNCRFMPSLIHILLRPHIKFYENNVEIERVNRPFIWRVFETRKRTLEKMVKIIRATCDRCMQCFKYTMVICRSSSKFWLKIVGGVFYLSCISFLYSSKSSKRRHTVEGESAVGELKGSWTGNKRDKNNSHANVRRKS